MPKEVTVTVPTVDDVVEPVKDLVETVEDDLEETYENSKPANLTVTQKVLIGALVAGGVALVVRKIRKLRRTVEVDVEDPETGEVVSGKLELDED